MSPASAPGLVVRLFGPLQIERAGAPVAVPASRKARAILGFLVMSPRPVTRQRLCELFFDTPDDPRASLRWNLTKLRAALDEPAATRIVSAGDTLSFASAGARVDVLDVLGAAPDAPLPDVPGPFLEDAELPDRQDFMIWLHSTREELRTALIRRLRGRLAEADTTAESGLSLSRKLLMLDPLDELATAGVVRSLGSLGRLADAREAASDAERAFRRAGLSPPAALRDALKSVQGPRAAKAIAVTSAAEQPPPEPAQTIADMLPVVAIVPFQNYSPDMIGEELMDRFLESVIHMFSRFRSLRILPLRSAMALKGGMTEPGALRTEGAKAAIIIGGSLMAREGRVRLRYRVVDAVDGSLLSSGDTDRHSDLAAAMLEELPADLVVLLVHQVFEVLRSRAAAKPVSDRNAYEHYVCGMSDAYLTTHPDYPAAMAHFQSALAVHPNYAAAMAGLAHCKGLLGLARLEPARSEALALAHAAIANANDDAYALALAGWSLVQIAGEVGPALRATDLAIRVNPLARVAWNTSAWVRAMNGEYETPMIHWQKAETCSPLGASSDQTNAGRALCCWMAGRYADALAWAKLSLERVPSNPGSLTAGLAAAVMLKDIDQARAISRTLLQFYPDGADSQVIAAVPILVAEKRDAILAAVSEGLLMGAR